MRLDVELVLHGRPFRTQHVKTCEMTARLIFRRRSLCFLAFASAWIWIVLTFTSVPNDGSQEPRVEGSFKQNQRLPETATDVLPDPRLVEQIDHDYHHISDEPPYDAPISIPHQQCELDQTLLVPPPSSLTNDVNFVSPSSAYLGADLKLMFCVMHKTAHTQILALFAKKYLNFQGDMGASQSELERIWTKRPPTYNHANANQRREVFEDSEGPYNRFTLVRDPLERFISGYLHICWDWSAYKGQGYCWSCTPKSSSMKHPDPPAAFRCFVERHLTRMTTLGRQNLAGSAPNMFHFYPQSWFCGLGVLKDKYTKIFKLTPDGIEEMKKSLVDIGWPRDQIYNGWGANRDEEFMANKPVHALAAREEAALKESGFGKPHIIEMLSTNRTLAEYFARVYYSDYLNFDFERPEWFRRHCDDCGEACCTWAICELGRST